MIPIFLAGLALIFTGCASVFVSKREDGLLTTEASAIDSKGSALELATERARNYCENRSGYAVINLPIFSQETVPIYADDCETPVGRPIFPIKQGPEIPNLRDANYSTRCISRFSYDATKWTARLIFKCNE